MSDTKTALVISAHAADFVWRCGGAIALHAQKGYDVTVVCLSFGERGESAKLWKQPGMTLDKVKVARQAEAEKAAAALGVHDIQFFDCGDYPLEMSREQRFRLGRRKRPPAIRLATRPTVEPKNCGLARYSSSVAWPSATSAKRPAASGTITAWIDAP